MLSSNGQSGHNTNVANNGNHSNSVENGATSVVRERAGRRRAADRKSGIYNTTNLRSASFTTNSPPVTDVDVVGNSDGNNSQLRIPPLSTTTTTTTTNVSKAARLVQSIHDEFLICKICLDSYKTPKSLSCLHTFCEDCIENHVSAESLYKRYTDYRDFTCPLCRKRTQLPLGGVKKLPDNFLIASLLEVVNRQRETQEAVDCEFCRYTQDKRRIARSRCLECYKLLCDDCLIVHRQTKVTSGHSIIDLEIGKDVICKTHQDEIVRYYCEPCQLCVCVLCTFTEHRQHEVMSFSEAILRHKGEVEQLLEQCKKKCQIMEETMEILANSEKNIQNIEQQIRDTAIHFISMIRQSERTLIEQLHSMYGQRTVDFIAHKADIMTEMENLISTCRLTEVILHGRDIELLLLKGEVCSKLLHIMQMNGESTDGSHCPLAEICNINETATDMLGSLIDLQYSIGHVELGILHARNDVILNWKYRPVVNCMDKGIQVAESNVKLITTKSTINEKSTQTLLRNNDQRDAACMTTDQHCHQLSSKVLTVDRAVNTITNSIQQLYGTTVFYGDFPVSCYALPSNCTAATTSSIAIMSQTPTTCHTQTAGNTLKAIGQILPTNLTSAIGGSQSRTHLTGMSRMLQITPNVSSLSQPNNIVTPVTSTMELCRTQSPYYCNRSINAVPPDH